MFIVQYQGGGYDGCFWEWNFAAINAAKISEATEFEDIFSSGYAGCKNLDSLKEVEEPIYIYDMSDPEQVKDFDKSANPQSVMGVAEWIMREHADEYPVDLMRCDHCGESLAEEVEYGDTRVLTGWHGCGGIASQPEGKFCSDCRETNAYEGYWKGEILQELEKRDIELPEEGQDRIIWGAMRDSDNYMEEDSEGFSLDVDALADYIENNRASLLDTYYNEDDQMEFVA